MTGAYLARIAFNYVAVFPLCPIHRYSGAKPRTRAPGKKNCGTMHEFTALECPEVAQWLFGDCDRVR